MRSLGNLYHYCSLEKNQIAGLILAGKSERPTFNLKVQTKQISY
jgi:hypothetical protein